MKIVFTEILYLVLRANKLNFLSLRFNVKSLLLSGMFPCSMFVRVHRLNHFLYVHLFTSTQQLA